MEVKIITPETPERRILKDEMEFYLCIETRLKEQGFEVLDTTARISESHTSPCQRPS